MAAMTSFRAEKCYRLLSEKEASVPQVCSNAPSVPDL